MIMSARPPAAAFALALFVATLSGTGPCFAQGAGEGFRELPITPGQATSVNFIELLLPYVSDHPETNEGNAGLDLDIRRDGEVYRVDILLTGYLDDSISGELYRGTVRYTANGEWELVSMAVKTFCARGQARDGLCP